MQRAQVERGGAARSGIHHTGHCLPRPAEWSGACALVGTNVQPLSTTRNSHPHARPLRPDPRQELGPPAPARDGPADPQPRRPRAWSPATSRWSTTRQRASAGLIITEGTQPSAVGQGYLNTPGIHTPEQVAGWRRVADAVHARGGRIVVQLMHAGRVAHPDNKDGLETVAPSALAAPNEMFTADGMKPHPVPRALATDEIPGDRRGVRARRPQRGRGRARRCRGARRQRLPAPPVPRAGLQRAHRRVRRQPGEPRPPRPSRSPAPSPRRSAPSAWASGSRRPTTSRAPPRRTRPTSRRRTPRSSRASPRSASPTSASSPTRRLDLVQRLRKDFGGVLIANDGFGQRHHPRGRAGAPRRRPRRRGRRGPALIANPDLPQRWQSGAELNEPDPSTFYGGGAEGYTDYPSLAA